MVHFRVVHHGRRWARPGNHLDGRVCPECGATVHGNAGQRSHQRYHDETNGVLVKLCQRTGITEEQVDLPWTWTAAVDDAVPAVPAAAELEAAEEA